MLKHDRAVAEPLDRARIVGHEDDGPSRTLEVPDPPEALLLERLVSDGQHLVEQQHVRLDVHRHGEPEAHVHPGRVGTHWHVLELFELGEVDDLVQVFVDVAALESVDRSVEVHVLDAGELGMEARPDLDQ